MTTQAARFDAAYYRKFYLTPATRAMSRQQTETRASAIAWQLKQLDIPVRGILDVGCGLGWYRRPLAKVFPAANYVGTEISDYLCATHGWIRGSLLTLKFQTPFDLVICADVLQYLNNDDADRGLRNLARWCGGALYFHAPTRGDWRDNVDASGTDGNVHVRSATWYRARLRRHFVHAGCGVYVKRNVPFLQWELEQPWR
jgi:SAM-dependent methyltransferase